MEDHHHYSHKYPIWQDLEFGKSRVCYPDIYTVPAPLDKLLPSQIIQKSQNPFGNMKRIEYLHKVMYAIWPLGSTSVLLKWSFDLSVHRLQ
jgi:hypothetical protein